VVGLDFRHASAGLLGKGCYLATKASYSNSYAYQHTSSSKQLLVAKFLPGRIKYVSSADQSLIKAPDGFHCIAATHSTSLNYTFYDFYRAFPAYLISYSGESVVD
jgi:hypothetical protein